MKRFVWMFLALLTVFALAVPVLGAAALADGSYTVALTMQGGTGKARIASPVEVEKQGDLLTATVVWSSSNYDRMTVDGVDYYPISLEDGAVFQIPIVLDEDMEVMAETVAMSVPHDIAYTLHFDGATLTAAGQAVEPVIIAVGVAAVLVVCGVVFLVVKRKKTA